MKKQQHDTEDGNPSIEPKRFWTKLSRFAKRAGREVLEKALILFYVAQSEHIPRRVRVMIVGALGYFISTIDAIPDITPMIGFADDLGILVAVVGAIAAWINPSIQDKVDQKLKEYLGEDNIDAESLSESSVSDQTIDEQKSQSTDKAGKTL